jgi:undecaprenyl-diphosphatase
MNDIFTIVWKSAALGIVEGVTEFLPISSTGHMIVASRALGFGSPQFEIFIQLGAMLALTWAYRERLVVLASDLPSRPEARSLVAKILVAFVPAAAIGVVAHHWIEENLFSASFVAITLIAGGIVILLVDGPQRRGGTADLEQIGFGQATAIGAGQALSLLPGVSRSGSTIITGLLAGLDRSTATDFSFLLALPTMYAACLFTLWKARNDLAGQEGLAMAVGLVAAYISALLVIRAFLAFVKNNSLRPFGWYRIIAGILVLAWVALT